jgi:hypothetical protein
VHGVTIPNRVGTGGDALVVDGAADEVAGIHDDALEADDVSSMTVSLTETHMAPRSPPPKPVYMLVSQSPLLSQRFQSSNCAMVILNSAMTSEQVQTSGVSSLLIVESTKNSWYGRTV